jgi:hypothetical protein
MQILAAMQILNMQLKQHVPHAISNIAIERIHWHRRLHSMV